MCKTKMLGLIKIMLFIYGFLYFLLQILPPFPTNFSCNNFNSIKMRIMIDIFSSITENAKITQFSNELPNFLWFCLYYGFYGTMEIVWYCTKNLSIYTSMFHQPEVICNLSFSFFKIIRCS